MLKTKHSEAITKMVNLAPLLLTLKLHIFIQWRNLNLLLGYIRGLVLTLLGLRNPFWVRLGYFLTISLLGFVALKVSNPRITTSTKPSDFDLFFTCISFATVSSLSTIEMEYFSDTQLIFLIILTFLGGGVFTSMIGLYFRRLKVADSISKLDDHIEIVISTSHQKESSKPVEEKDNFLKYKSIKILAIIVTCYLVLVQVASWAAISIYFRLVSSARDVIKNKGINMYIFTIFTAVSTFTNCGFLPTNENMMVFKKNTGLLLILIPQILMGDTMFPVFLRTGIWVLAKITNRVEFNYILKNSSELGYKHLFPGLHTIYLLVMGFAFVILQWILFCALEWNAELTVGLTGYEKLVAFLFQVVNARHAGESVFNLASISTAIIVVFVVTMYLPSYFIFLPIKKVEKLALTVKERNMRKKEKCFWDHILLSQLSYLAIFIIVICITEREKIKSDPLNFNLLNITVEVIAGYGNVGFSMGYSCKKRINPQGDCRSGWYGFAGRLSNEGKFVLIVAMLYGRLKPYTMNGGRAWIVLPH